MSGQIEDAIRALIIADATLQAGVASRIYPHRAPQGAATPYMVYRPGGSEPWHHIEDQSAKGYTWWDLEIWGDGYEALRALMDQARVVLGGHRGTVTISAGPPAVTLFVSSIWIEDYGMLGPDARDGSDLPSFGASLTLRCCHDLRVT